MEATVAQRLYPMWIDLKTNRGKLGGLFPVSPRPNEWRGLQVLVSNHLQPHKTANRNRLASLEVSCCYSSAPASLLESGGFHAPVDEGLVLKKKSKEIEPYLNGRSIYLVGMMGSGKTTIGKILAQVLGYSFFDSDALVEKAMDGTSVAEIFMQYGESFFRDKETEVLQKLSLMNRHVISTGGGAVTRPINWKYMQKGITIWLDVPLEALARRIAAVGTNSRPLLHHESGDEYTKALKRLCTLFEERGESYTQAKARVSLERIVVKLGYGDVSNLTPNIIAIEALEQIEGLLEEEEGGMAITGF